ncbi:ribonuclease H-like domain-containing protein [Microdochium trichocladiopsis]|uniref:ribonuclease H n=1 Tax=Microdochium trichocladiopsis TaxID=1682393 RepID=A0A9P8XRD9_9PEZI|nr:ribonuclease H-like domain-containing protein [Microdochium trichocladiopsis]KAH7012527.1 ribonuclease H-like domain-containing protein [Microdochium trichocladiopsis]
MGITTHSSNEHERSWASNRKFEPELRYSEDCLDLIEVRRTDDPWTFVACDNADPCESCGSLGTHIDCVIIAVDGACRNNGDICASAAVGVFVGDESTFNISMALEGTKVTSQIAELRAGICGLKQALKIQRSGIKGAALAQGMTEWMFRWEKNGYKTSSGKPAANLSLFKQLNELVKELNNLGVEVLFWHVPRDRNEDADRLARAA